MSTQARRIGYYNFVFKKYKVRKDKNFFNNETFINLLMYINGLSDKERIINIEEQKKAVSIEKIVFTDNKLCAKVVFKSCKYNHSPKYMSSVDGAERDSDKKNFEGEKEKTHLCIKFYDDEAEVILEERKTGVTISKIVDYFEQKLNLYLESIGTEKNYKILYGIIPLDNFKEILNGMKDVKVAEIYTNKKLLGSEGYNIMDREDPCMRDDIMITAKAKKSLGLQKRIMQNTYDFFVSGKSEIKRIRIYGQDNRGNVIKLDSDVIKKTEYINAILDADGTINTESIFDKMIKFLEVNDE